MNKTFKRVLATFLLLCMIPATVLTAIANGPGVAGNLTENQSHDLAYGQYIPETVVVDGKFDDAGWAVEEWTYVNTNTGSWDSEVPAELNMTASYKYQLHYDRNYFYFATVIAMPEGVTEGKFAVYLSETKATLAAHTNRGTTAGFVFDIKDGEVTVAADKGGDELTVEAYKNGTYTPDDLTKYPENVPTDNGGKAWLEDELFVADVDNGIVTIEFRNKLDATIDMSYTIFGGVKDTISYYVALWLDHGTEANEAGNEYDMLFHPVWSQGGMTGFVRTFEPRGDYWPIEGGGVSPKKLDTTITGITIDGNLEEELWQNANADFTHVNAATGHYYIRPYEGESLSYSFAMYNDSTKLYGVAILDVEATAANPENKFYGTEFGIWFDNGHDERLEITTSGSSTSCEYQFFRNETEVWVHDSSNTSANPDSNGKRETHYATELRYYINHNVNFRLYGEQYNNARDSVRNVDTNPDVAPDYFYNGTDYTIKQNGQHYQYAYKVINGKTYVEFFVDLQSVRCANNDDFKMFVYAQHDIQGGGTAENVYTKLYYPSLKTDDQSVQNIIWLTDYNSYGDDIRYGAKDPDDGTYGRVMDNIGIIFDNYTKYKDAAKEYRWWHQVCLKSLGGNKYQVAEILEAQGYNTGDLKYLSQAPKGSGTYLWYAMNTGDYYSENYYLNGTTKILAPLDKRNYMATEAYQQINKWQVGDVLEFNFDYKTVTTARNVIRYTNRLNDTSDPDAVDITSQGKVTTSQLCIQDVGHTRGRYVKFAIKNNNLTFLGEIAAYGKTGNLISSGKKVTVCHLSANYGPTSVLTNGSVFSNQNMYNAKDSNGAFCYAGISSDTHAHELVIDLGSIQDIYNFGISYASNADAKSVFGISCPEEIMIYVSDDEQNWTYASHVTPVPDNGDYAAGILSVKWAKTAVQTSGTDAQAYYSPYTVTRTMNAESMEKYYARRNSFMPRLDYYGNVNGWMYGTAENIVSSQHIAPQVIKIDGILGDTGWSADKWIKADPAVNATAVDGVKINSEHQIRTDGEYLYVSALIDSNSENLGLDFWVNYDGGLKKFTIGRGSTTIPVEVPDSTAACRVDEYNLVAASGLTYGNGSVTYPFDISVKEWKNSAWSDVAYEDSTFYGYTKELIENKNKDLTTWEANPQTTGFRYGIDSAVMKLSEADNNTKSVVEFKIALSEIGNGNGIKYYFAVKDGSGATYYPKIYGDVAGLETDPANAWILFNTSKVLTKADLSDGGKCWLRNDYAPMTSLGAKVNDNYNGHSAIRFAARYTEDFIKRSEVNPGTDYWSVADAGIIILPTAMITEESPLAIENENVARASALDIVDWKNEAPAGDTNFADYESFTFYVNLVGVETIKEVPLTFSAYIDYYNSNGSKTFYSIPLERSYSLVEKTTNEGTVLPGQN